MGYGYFCPVLIYGFIDKNKNETISKEYIEHITNEKVSSYASEINKNYILSTIIGIKSYIKDDKLTYQEDHLLELLKFKKKYEKFYKTKVDINFYTAIYGDYEDDRQIISPDFPEDDN